jgi:histidine decarboxylase
LTEKRKPMKKFALLISCSCILNLYGQAPKPSPELTQADVVAGAISPFNNYCDGYGNPGSSGLGYISFLKLEIGKVKMDMDPGLEGIVSYDRAETQGAYIGQINMITVSSFNGLNGVIWGYDLAKEEDLANQTKKPLFSKMRKDGKSIPVYSMDSLLDAGLRLRGTNDARRFPPLPGAHVPCATKSETLAGPTSIWCGAALAIAEDRTRDANLFIEDAGHDQKALTEKERDEYLRAFYEKVVDSIIRCGDDSNVKYKEIYIGYKSEWIPKGYVGCSLVCAPYVVLAKNAIPSNKLPKDLLRMTITEWEKSLGLVPAEEKSVNKKP